MTLTVGRRHAGLVPSLLHTAEDALDGVVRDGLLADFRVGDCVGLPDHPLSMGDGEWLWENLPKLADSGGE